MSHITVAFSHNKNDWISRVMAWVTFADYSHVAIVNGDEVIESSSVGSPKGVRRVTLDTYLARHPGTVIRKIIHAHPERVWERCKTRIGCGYDWAWIWGYLARKRDWQDPEKFTCQELIVWACAIEDDPLFVGDNDWHIVPQQLYMISKD